MKSPKSRYYKFFNFFLFFVSYLLFEIFGFCNLSRFVCFCLFVSVGVYVQRYFWNPFGLEKGRDNSGIWEISRQLKEDLLTRKMLNSSVVDKGSLVKKTFMGEELIVKLICCIRSLASFSGVMTEDMAKECMSQILRTQTVINVRRRVLKLADKLIDGFERSGSLVHHRESRSGKSGLKSVKFLIS